MTERSRMPENGNEKPVKHPGNSVERSANNSCAECGSTVVYRMDPRLGDRPLCWNCWVVGIDRWRAKMRGAGRCPNCGGPAEPFVYCPSCRSVRAENKRAQYARYKAAEAERQAALQQQEILHAGERGAQQALIDWRAAIDGPTLLAAFTDASGDYAGALARLNPPSWRIERWSRRGYAADGSWPRPELLALAQVLGVTEEMRTLRRTLQEERRARRPTAGGAAREQAALPQSGTHLSRRHTSPVAHRKDPKPKAQGRAEGTGAVRLPAEAPKERGLVSRICGYVEAPAGRQVCDTKRLPAPGRCETHTPFW